LGVDVKYLVKFKSKWGRSHDSYFCRLSKSGSKNFASWQWLEYRGDATLFSQLWGNEDSVSWCLEKISNSGRLSEGDEIVISAIPDQSGLTVRERGEALLRG